MIVVDASILVELLTDGAFADPIKHELQRRGQAMIAPHLIDVETFSALGRIALNRRVFAERGAEFLEVLASLPLERYEHSPLLPRIWELRNNFTAYDAAYIALAETANAVLFTCDRKLSRGHSADVVVFDAS
jgi:predicted nucleic acid-binding protein